MARQKKLTDNCRQNLDAQCELLPWYVNGTLSDAECKAMEQHLQSCDNCQEDFPLLSGVKVAMRRESVSVLAPQSSADQLFAHQGPRGVQAGKHKLAWYATAIAAGAALFAIALNWNYTIDSVVSPATFKTATAANGDVTFDYVFAVSFRSDIVQTERRKALQRLAPVSLSGPDSSGNYRVVFRLPARSMAEIDIFRKNIEADTSITSAAIIAVEIPVESP